MENYKVYKHTFPNGKVYIGITNLSTERRWRKDGSGYKFQVVYNAIKKYGWDNIKHEVLFENLTKEEAEKKEIELIFSYKSNQYKYGYNIANGGNCAGSVSEETRKKMSESRKGLLVGEKNPMWRKEVSSETRKKISESNKGKKLSDEIIQKIANKNRGKKRTLEQRKKMSDSAKGKIVSAETRKKLSLKSKGRKLKEETKIKISLSNKGKHGSPCSEETKRKLSIANGGKNNFFYGKHHTDEVKELLRNKLSKPIVCVETGKIYINTKAAAIELGNKDRTNILCVLRGKSKTAYGYHWRYLNEE